MSDVTSGGSGPASCRDRGGAAVGNLQRPLTRSKQPRQHQAQSSLRAGACSAHPFATTRLGWYCIGMASSGHGCSSGHGGVQPKPCLCLQVNTTPTRKTTRSSGVRWWKSFPIPHTMPRSTSTTTTSPSWSWTSRSASTAMSPPSASAAGSSPTPCWSTGWGRWAAGAACSSAAGPPPSSRSSRCPSSTGRPASRAPPPPSCRTCSVQASRPEAVTPARGTAEVPTPPRLRAPGFSRGSPAGARNVPRQVNTASTPGSPSTWSG